MVTPPSTPLHLYHGILIRGKWDGSDGSHGPFFTHITASKTSLICAESRLFQPWTPGTLLLPFCRLALTQKWRYSSMPETSIQSAWPFHWFQKSLYRTPTKNPCRVSLGKQSKPPQLWSYLWKRNVYFLKIFFSLKKAAYFLSF